MPGELTALLSAICYSFTYIFLRRGQVELHTEDNGLFPVLLVSGFVLTIFTIAKALLHPPFADLVVDKFSPESVYLCAMSGIVGTFLGRFALYGAIKHVGPTRGIVVKTLAPVVTLVTALWFLREHVDEFDITGMVLLAAGIVLLILERRWTNTRSFTRRFLHRGIILGFSAAVLQGFGHTLRKLSLATSIDPLLAAALDVLAALAAYTLFLALSPGRRRSLLALRPWWNGQFVAAGVMSSAGVLLFFTAISTVPVSTVSVIIATEPIIVALLAALLLKRIEQLSWITAVSAALVALGVILISAG